MTPFQKRAYCEKLVAALEIEDFHSKVAAATDDAEELVADFNAGAVTGVVPLLVGLEATKARVEWINERPNRAMDKFDSTGISEDEDEDVELAYRRELKQLEDAIPKMFTSLTKAVDEVTAVSRQLNAKA